ncbi:TOBE domain-containing protein [Sulfurihydrogenibium sp.]|uniref:TOBE domain-containing protein n=1 Tax=Sulfurihydrogenibium sp. TaxID=2053621 RepID=UPI00262EC747|nr:TOBE domain-containing protein [Sulfurihydrogenibium sp.]
MNIVKGYIVGIEFTDTISQIKLNTEIGDFYCVVLENPDTANYLKIDNTVNLIFKETDFVVCRDKIHPFNTFQGTVKSIFKGQLFTRVFIENKGLQFSALITNLEFDNLLIDIGSQIYFYIKPTNIILEV